MSHNTIANNGKVNVVKLFMNGEYQYFTIIKDNNVKVSLKILSEEYALGMIKGLNLTSRNFSNVIEF
jgi:hypothetical protein